MVLTAPYDESMRLGQGFNSYYQSTRMYSVVTATGTVDSSTSGDPEDGSQSVSISSQFLTKVSDVVSALGISAASCIGFGNCVGGGFINLNKLAEADIVFVSRVQVTTLTSSLSADAKLCSLDPTVLDDDSICGDTFISGFLKGGEFSSIVSVKVHDKNRIGKVRAQLEMYIRSLQTITPPLAELDAAGETEISISVQWRGGQVDFPDSGCAWSIAGVIGAATRFPKTCQSHPEYHSAILSRYRSLPSFCKLPSRPSIPQYRVARIYTSHLLDEYAQLMRLEMTLECMRLNVHSYDKAPNSSAYAPTVAGLDSASFDIRKSMTAINREVIRIRKDPTVAKEALKKDKDVYTKPSAIVSRLPVPALKVDVLSDVVNKPISALPAGQTVDARLWQWVHVPGWDSPDNNVFQHGEGGASPTEMMHKINEWEAAHPGHFIAGFNLRGEAKGKIQKWKDLRPSLPGCDLYVRVLCDDRWMFAPLLDSSGRDVDTGYQFDHSVDIDIIEALRVIEPISNVVAFNSAGYTKHKVEFPLWSPPEFAGKPQYFGIWIRKSALNLSWDVKWNRYEYL